MADTPGSDLPAATDVVVVGAGLAGLSAARATIAAGLDTVVVEASDGVGGRVRTDEVDGFLLDRGFQILLTAYPELRIAVDLEALDLCRFEPGALVWTGDRFDRVVDPFRRPASLPATLRADVGGIVDKARIAALRRRVTSGSAAALLRGPDLSTEVSLRQQGFSADMIERFLRPFVGGIQLDPSLATSSRMFDVIFRCLATGDAAVPARGMVALPAQMAAALPAGTVHLRRPVAEVAGREVRLADGGRIRGRAVVVATEGPVAARLLGLADPGSKEASAVWFAASVPPTGSRALLLDGTGGVARNVAVLSNVAPGYAPPGRTLVAAAVPGQARRDVLDPVRAQLRGWFGPSVQDWEVLRVDLIHHGQPSARPPFRPRRPVALGDGRYVCGDHRDTPSIQGAMFSGRRCGERVVLDLGALGRG